MAEDRLYAVPKPVVSDFSFGTDTAAVFDDMLPRSVPFYNEIQRMIAEMVADFAVDGTNIYDLGCSTCSTFRNLHDLDKNVTMVGIDSSAAMLARAEEELKRANFRHRYTLRRADLHQGLEIENASVVIMSLTLQFVRPLSRERVMQTIYNGMNHQGCLILRRVATVGMEALTHQFRCGELLADAAADDVGVADDEHAQGLAGRGNQQAECIHPAVHLFAAEEMLRVGDREDDGEAGRGEVVAKAKDEPADACRAASRDQRAAPRLYSGRHRLRPGPLVEEEPPPGLVTPRYRTGA